MTFAGFAAYFCCDFLIVRSLVPKFALVKYTISNILNIKSGFKPFDFNILCVICCSTGMQRYMKRPGTDTVGHWRCYVKLKPTFTSSTKQDSQPSTSVHRTDTTRVLGSSSMLAPVLISRIMYVKYNTSTLCSVQQVRVVITFIKLSNNPIFIRILQSRLSFVT